MTSQQIIAFAIVAAAGCAHPLRLTSADQGRSIELAVGDNLTVQLETNHSTPVRWAPAASANTLLTQLGEATYEPRASGGRVGVGGVETWTFRAAVRGTADLRMEARHIGSTDPAPLMSVIYHVTVR